MNDRYMIIEQESLASMQNAIALVSKKEYVKAEIILEKYCTPELLSKDDIWNFNHDCIELYAYCLQNMSDKQKNSMQIYEKLYKIKNKPPLYYINYSLCLLRYNIWKRAKEICREGLSLYPCTLELMGNYTICLLFCGKIEEAYKNAIKRIDLRRDIKSIEELANVYAKMRNNARNNDLPKALEYAKCQFELIKEGLSIDPDYQPLKIIEIQLFRFCNSGTASELSKNMINDKKTEIYFKELALVEFIRILYDFKYFDLAIEHTNQVIDNLKFNTPHNTLLYEKFKFIAEHHMIGKNYADNKKVVVKEVLDFFLQKNECNRYIYPYMAGRVLEWLGKADEAEMILRYVIEKDGQDVWKATKELVLLLERKGEIAKAVSEAYNYAARFPWRAETYDILSFVLKSAGDDDLSVAMKKKGDQVFELELKYLEDFRKMIS